MERETRASSDRTPFTFTTICPACGHPNEHDLEGFVDGAILWPKGIALRAIETPRFSEIVYTLWGPPQIRYDVSSVGLDSAYAVKQ